MHEDLQSRLIRDLVTESNESLDQFDQELLLLEKGEASADALDNIFRVIHSLKGTSGCLGLTQIEALAHVGENLLSLLREGQLSATPQIVTKLLAYADALREMLKNLDVQGVEAARDNSALINDLRLLSEVSAAPIAEEREVFGLFDEEPVLPAAQQSLQAPVEVAPTPQEFVNSEAKSSEVNRNTAPAAAAVAVAPETAIRVDIAQLDGMMDLVGELVLARNQMVQFTGRIKDPSLLGATQRLNIITTKLQETVMKTRMQPISNVWNKFPRIVRDISGDLGKQVRLVMEGKDTDLDRNIIEAIKDPLTHLVRNSIDHGLETPALRVRAGKAEEGLLRLRAFHEGGQVNIEIYDDGAGIDREKVLKRAIQKGLVQSTKADEMSEREVFSLLFAPGFSTAEKVTNLSGRGVGMDVVKKNIERIGGSVDIQSEFGRSTTIRIRIPLTLAIIPALIIRCGSSRYAIPQVSLVELVRIESEQAARSIEYVGGTPVYRLRGNLLPLVYLREQLKITSRDEAPADSIFMLVLQADSRQFGLVVDGIDDTEEIVVKPLGKELKGISVYAGATIMGDGRVALILDVVGLAHRSGVLQEVSRLEESMLNERDKNKTAADRQSLILFSLGESRQAAIPLLHVARLEEFRPDQIELGGDSEVVQYRGEIMPLVRVSKVLGMAGEERSGEDRVRVIVYNHHGSNIGLVVQRIVDTVDDEVTVQRSLNRPGILGSGVVRKRVTDFIDMDALMERSGVICFEGAVV